jgi:RimJ/RimL family protein N-acetyltransferase
MLGPAYRILTRRLVIRCWNPADAPLLKASVDENIDHLLPWMPWAADEPKPLQQKVDLIRAWRAGFDLGKDFVYGIFNREESRVLGGTGLHTRLGPGAREIGYWIHRDYTNIGLATEVSAALTRVAFEIDGVRRVEIHCEPRNIRSAAIPRKLGFTCEATLRERYPFTEDQYRDIMIWSLFSSDYGKTPCARVEVEAFDAMNRQILPAEENSL